MGIEKHVKRSGYALVSTVALLFLMTVMFGVAISRLDFSFGVMEAYSNRFQTRNELLSMTNLALKRLSEELRSHPLAKPPIELKDLTDLDSLLIFTMNVYDGCEARVYNLHYSMAVSFGTAQILPPMLKDGYMIRAVAEKKGMAPMTLESVYEARLVSVGENVGWALDFERPVYSRELFRR